MKPLLAIVPLLTVPLAAQGARVVPAAFAYVEGNSRHTYPFGRQEAQLQVLADGSELMATQGTILSLLFRPDGQPANTYPAYAKGYKVTVYATPVTAAQMTIDPVANRGTSTGTVVFNGTLNLPADPPTLPLPRGYPFRIAFTAPFRWQATQGNLLLHVETTDLTVPPGGWTVDAVQRSTLRAEGIGTPISAGCRNAGNDELRCGVTHASAVVGGSLPVQLASSRAGAFPLGVFVLGTTNQDPLLPLNLAFLGMPGCALDVELAFTLGVPETQGVYPPITVPIPNDPSLTDAAVYTQALGWAQPNQTFVGSVTSAAHVTVVGAATPRPASWQSIFYVATQQRWFMSGNGIALAPVFLLEGLFF
jgi:hypothetical protein